MAATLGVAACTDYDSATNLKPEGPPMIQQIRMKENFSPPNSSIVSTRRVFAFGSHPDAKETDAHPVTAATALGNTLRIIVDELLVGNNIEEIACRAAVDSDAYSRVPRGATPDDIAKCAGAQDVLPALCKGEFAVCICAIPGGCDVADEKIAEGLPVGVLDINQDGAADDTRMIAGAVGLRCGNIDVPINYDTSYWNPSGNQQVPAMGGFDALGPAIVLTPQVDGMPTNLDCSLTFSPEIIDKQGEAICTPAGGDPDAGCVAGDVSAFKFHTEALDFEPQTFIDGQTGVNRNDPVVIRSSVPVDMTTLNGITLTPTPAGAVTFTLMMKQNIYINIAGGLAAATQYTLTVPTTVHDTFGQSAPAAKVLTFTTGN
jgi:hypothetical protein